MIALDTNVIMGLWLEAGQVFATYAERRRKQKKGQPRQLLADFVIAAHAKTVGSLLTDTWYKTTPNFWSSSN